MTIVNTNTSRVIPMTLLAVVVAVVVALDAPSTAQAQPYCAMYDDGSKGCGIPSLQSCEQSLSGVGGNCVLDMTSQMRPDLFKLFPQQPPQSSTPSNQNNPQDPNWMPPPPGQ
jgi:hypothetical protein